MLDGISASSLLSGAKNLGKAAVNAAGEKIEEARNATSEAVDKLEELATTKYSLIIPETEKLDGVMESDITFEKVQELLEEFGITLEEKK